MREIGKLCTLAQYEHIIVSSLDCRACFGGELRIVLILLSCIVLQDLSVALCCTSCALVQEAAALDLWCVCVCVSV